MLVCPYLNVHRVEGAEALKLNDFLPFPELNQEYAEKEQTTEEQVAILRRWAMNNGAIIKKRETHAA